MLRYQDIQGARTERRITLRRLEQRGLEPYLVAWCHLRRDFRSFRLERCLAISDPRMGAISATPSDWFEEAVGILRRDGALRQEPLSARAISTISTVALGMQIELHLTGVTADGTPLAGGFTLDEILQRGWEPILIGYWHETRRRRSFYLRELRTITDSETSVVYEDLNAWYDNLVEDLRADGQFSVG